MRRAETQAPWETRGQERAVAVRELFNGLASSYDRANAWMTLGADRAWRRNAVAQLDLRRGDRVLDLCCGTGAFFAPLRDAVGGEGSVVGVDFSRPMLALGVGADGMAQADALRLPVRSGSFHAVTVGWGMRNVAEPDIALREAFRALRPGGRLAVVEAVQTRPGGLADRAKDAVTRCVGRLVGQPRSYEYLARSMQSFDTPDRFAQRMRHAGFQDVKHRTYALGLIALHIGRRP